MSISIVQVGTNTGHSSVAAYANTPASLAITLASAVTAGNALVVFAGVHNDGPVCGNGSLNVTDNVLDTFSAAVSAGSPFEGGPGLCFFVAPDAIGGSTTVTFSFEMGGGPAGGNYTISMLVIEYAGMVTPSIQSSAYQQIYGAAGGSPITLSAHDGAGFSVGTEFTGATGPNGGPGTDISLCVVDLLVAGTNFFLAGAASYTTQGVNVPSVVPSSYGSYTLEEELSSGLTLYLWDFGASGSGGTTSPPSSPATLPPIPPPEFIEWEMDDAVGAARSPFSKQQQLHNWNASLLRATLTYPEAYNSTAMPLLVFLMAAQGQNNSFFFGDPQNLGPQNLAATAGTVTGSGQTGYTLVTSSTNLTPGDWIQVGFRLYRVTSVSGGTLGIWPNLRESPADATPLVIHNTQGLFRLAKNQRQYSVKPGQIVERITIEIEEAFA